MLGDNPPCVPKMDPSTTAVRGRQSKRSVSIFQTFAFQYFLEHSSKNPQFWVMDLDSWFPRRMVNLSLYLTFRQRSRQTVSTEQYPRSTQSPRNKQFEKGILPPILNSSIRSQNWPCTSPQIKTGARTLTTFASSWNIYLRLQSSLYLALSHKTLTSASLSILHFDNLSMNSSKLPIQVGLSLFIFQIQVIINHINIPLWFSYSSQLLYQSFKESRYQKYNHLDFSSPNIVNFIDSKRFGSSSGAAACFPTSPCSSQCSLHQLYGFRSIFLLLLSIYTANSRSRHQATQKKCSWQLKTNQKNPSFRWHSAYSITGSQHFLLAKGIASSLNSSYRILIKIFSRHPLLSGAGGLVFTQQSGSGYMRGNLVLSTCLFTTLQLPISNFNKLKISQKVIIWQVLDELLNFSYFDVSQFRLQPKNAFHLFRIIFNNFTLPLMLRRPLLHS